MLNLIANTEIEKRIFRVLNPFFLNRGLRLVKISLQKARKYKLLIFIDKKDGKLSVNECANISKETFSIIEVESILDFPYRLEISSAGIDRSLTSLEDFKKYLNYNVNVKCFMNKEKGKLIDFTSNTITLSGKNGDKFIKLSSVLDVKIDLEGMTLETIKEMEYI